MALMRIGELLQKKGLLNERELEQILVRQKEDGLRFGDVVVQDGYLTQKELDNLLFYRNEYFLENLIFLKGFYPEKEWRRLVKISLEEENRQKKIQDILLQESALDEKELFVYLAQSYELEFIEKLDPFPSPPVLGKFDPGHFRRFRFIPRDELETGVWLILIDDPTLKMLDALRSFYKSDFVCQLTTPSSLNFWLTMIAGEENMDMSLVLDEDGTGEITEYSEESSSIIEQVNNILLGAVTREASDIHFEPALKNLNVLIRLDGILMPLMVLPLDFHRGIVARLKILSNLNTTERRVPQDGKFRLKIRGRDIDFRISTLPSIHGEGAVLRILDRSSKNLSIPDLGMAFEQERDFLSALKSPYGMLLVSGPTGSGKTTTLYAAMETIKTRDEKFITIEDPVEYEMKDVLQINVNEAQGMTFSLGLRSIVRHDPDKILIGEIRDLETAEIAIQASLTGHLVLSTIHANNSVDSISRLLNMGIEAYQFVSAFNLIMAQRLVRKICTHCAGKQTTAKKWGCDRCHFTGFKGRQGIFEVIPIVDEIKQMVLDGISPLKISQFSREKGWLTLRQSGLNLVTSGITSLEEINRITMVDKVENVAKVDNVDNVENGNL